MNILKHIIQAITGDKISFTDTDTDTQFNKSRLLTGNVLTALQSTVFSLVFFTANANAFTVACPSEFPSDVVCSCSGGELFVTSGGSTSSFGPDSICEVSGANGMINQQYMGLQNVVVGAQSRQFFPVFGVEDDLDDSTGDSFDAFDASIKDSFGPFTSFSDYYTPSALPEWDFSSSIQGNLGSSEISLPSSPDLKSDYHSVAVNLRAIKNALSISSQLRYRSIEGRGITNGLDIRQYSLMLTPAYQILKQAEQGVNLALYGFLDISGNDNKNIDDQTRLASGAGFDINRRTPLGLFKLGYTFTHDRNFDNDTEITGDQYFNIHQFHFSHSLKLLQSLLFTTQLSHLQLTDLPGSIEDSGSNAGFGISYIGLKNMAFKFNYVKSFDGYGREGGSLSISYNW